MKLALEIGIDPATLETEESRLSVAVELMEGAAVLVSEAITEILLHGESVAKGGADQPQDLRTIFEGVTA